LIIDCHGHFTTAPKSLHARRKQQLDSLNDPANAPARADLVIPPPRRRQPDGS